MNWGVAVHGLEAIMLVFDCHQEMEGREVTLRSAGGVR